MSRPAARPEAYSHRVRLADQIEDARNLLTERGPQLPAIRCGQLEAMLTMICDTAGLAVAEGYREADDAAAGQ